MIKLRVDDFPWTKENERDRHTLKAFGEFCDVVRRHYNGYWLLGVIPGNCGAAELSYLRHKTSGIQIGMHGIYHNETYPNEFLPNLTVANIAQQLRMTRTLLSHAIEKPIDVYMPPHNVIDFRTVAALPDAGFKAFTTGPETPPAIVRQEFHDVKIFHSAKELGQYGRSDELHAQGATDRLFNLSARGEEIWLTLHWTWEVNIGLEHLDKFLSALYPQLHTGDL